MAALSAAARHHRARIAALEYAVKAGSREPGDPELAEARGSLAAARLADHIEKVIAQTTLTPQQVDALAALLLRGAR